MRSVLAMAPLIAAASLFDGAIRVAEAVERRTRTPAWRPGVAPEAAIDGAASGARPPAAGYEAPDGPGRPADAPCVDADADLAEPDGNGTRSDAEGGPSRPPPRGAADLTMSTVPGEELASVLSMDDDLVAQVNRLCEGFSTWPKHNRRTMFSPTGPRGSFVADGSYSGTILVAQTMPILIGEGLLDVRDGRAFASARCHEAWRQWRTIGETGRLTKVRPKPPKSVRVPDGIDEYETEIDLRRGAIVLVEERAGGLVVVRELKPEWGGANVYSSGLEDELRDGVLREICMVTEVGLYPASLIGARGGDDPRRNGNDWSTMMSDGSSNHWVKRQRAAAAEERFDAIRTAPSAGLVANAMRFHYGCIPFDRTPIGYRVGHRGPIRGLDDEPIEGTDEE